MEEAALIWLRRDNAICQPHYNLEELARLDDQLEAHLDGLRIADGDNADAVWEICERELAWGEPGEVFPAAILAFETDNPERIRRVLEAVGESYGNSRAFVSALGWLPWDQVSEYINRFRMSDDAMLRRVGIAACVAHGHDPETSLADAIGHANTLLNARALRAVGEFGRLDLLPAVGEQLTADDDHCRISAAWTIARLRASEQAIEVLKEIVGRNSTDAGRALNMVLRVMNSEAATTWSSHLRNDPTTARFGVQAIGIVGLPAADLLFEIMATPALARIAGEAFSMITGVDLAYQNLEGEWPDGFTAGPTEDPEDENVAMDPDENLPWPHAEKLRVWWEQHKGEFDSGKRYLFGQPLTESWLQHVLRHGFQRQRTAAALELAIRRPGEPVFNVRAPGFRQKFLLGIV